MASGRVCVKKVDILGPIALPVSKAIQGALDGCHALRLAAEISIAQEVASAKKHEVAAAKRFNFMFQETMIVVQSVEQAIAELNGSFLSRHSLDATTNTAKFPGVGKNRRSISETSVLPSGQAVELRTRSQDLEEMLAGSQEALKAATLEREIVALRQKFEDPFLQCFCAVGSYLAC